MKCIKATEKNCKQLELQKSIFNKRVSYFCKLIFSHETPALIGEEMLQNKGHH